MWRRGPGPFDVQLDGSDAAGWHAQPLFARVAHAHRTYYSEQDILNMEVLTGWRTGQSLWVYGNLSVQD